MPDPISPLTTTTRTGVNLRADSNGRATRLTTAPAGALVAALGNDADWLAVELGALRGYMSMPYLRGQQGGQTAWRTAVTSDSLNLRPTPGTDRPRLGAVGRGAVLEVLGFEGDWLMVRHGAGAAWVKSIYTSSRGLSDAAKLDPAAIALRRAEISRMADPQARAQAWEALQAMVEYRSQRDNLARDAQGALIEDKGGQMCNLTALAMALSVLGLPNPRPQVQYEDALEHIRQEKGLPQRTTSGGWGGVARAVGADVSFIPRSEFQEGQAWWEATIRPRLRVGEGVILSISGHIVRLQGFSDAGLIVDDPYGYSVLLPGTRWTFEGRNPYQSSVGAMMGSDVLWPWADVAKHTMRWIAAIVLPGPEEGVFAPLPDFDDEGPSDPSAAD